MKKMLSTVCAAVMAITGVISAPLAVSAAPMVPLVAPESSTNLQEVQYRRWPRQNMHRFRGVDRRFDRGGFYRNNGGAYYNGHRGYRNYRRGYRRHNDFWFPAGAFVAGALIGGALAAPSYDYAPRRVYRGGGSAHVQWCYDRYRSYDARSDTFQPYNGPRQRCYSPYN